MTIWRLIHSGSGDAYFNMALDEAISNQVQKGMANVTLRLYSWEKPSVSLGSFQNSQHIDLLYCIEKDIPVVRRPTGGRGIYHKDELTYSFSAPYDGIFSGGLFTAYYQLGIAFKSAFKSTGIDVSMALTKRSRSGIKTPLCFKSASYGELSFQGKKIIGSAQRRFKKGFLQQGSIPFSVDCESIKKIFKVQDDSCIDFVGIKDLVKDFNPDTFIANIQRAFEENFNITFVLSQPSSGEIDLAQKLVWQKYQPLC